MGPDVTVKVEGVGGGINDKYWISNCRQPLRQAVEEHRVASFTILHCLVSLISNLENVVNCTVSWYQGFHTYCAGVSIHAVLGFLYILCWGFHTCCTGVSIHTVLGFPYMLYWGYHTYCAGVSIDTVLGLPYILYWGFHRYCAGVSIHTVLGFPYILCWGFHTYCTGVSIHTVLGFP